MAFTNKAFEAVRNRIAGFYIHKVVNTEMDRDQIIELTIGTFCHMPEELIRKIIAECDGTLAELN
jgi:hypothetical protein